MPAAPTKPRTGLARRLALIGLGLLLALVAFEAALQVGALWNWRFAPREALAVVPGDERVVLCVGDSNTYGVGASDAEQAYPAVLERLLDTAGQGRHRVVNCGRPGRNSRELLLALPRQLATHRPAFVCVLVGTNDTWGLPEPVDEVELAAATEHAPGFPLRWRTGRMFTLLVSWLRAREDAAPRFVGRWHDPTSGTELWIDAAGRFSIDGFELRWRLDGDQLSLQTPEGRTMRVDYRFEDGLLLVSGGPLREQHTFVAGRLPEPLREKKAFTGGRIGETHTLAPGDPGFDAAFEAACARIETQPHDAVAWHQLQALELLPEHQQRLARLLRAGLPDVTEPGPRAVVLRGLCMTSGSRPMERLRWVVEAACLDGMDGPVVGLLPRLGVDQDAYAAVVHELAPTPERREVLLALWAQSRDRSIGFARVLEGHLRRVVELCRAAGAEPILIDYPLRIAEIEAVVARLGSELGVATVPLADTFARLLETEPYDSLFIPDGHPNDAGYRVLAAQVSQRLLAVRPR